MHAPRSEARLGYIEYCRERFSIPELIDILLKRAKARHDLPDIKISPAVIQRLISYRWPGNVRQLENVIERMLVLATSCLVTEQDLPGELQQLSVPQSSLWFDLPEGGISLEAVEKELIVRALDRFHGNQTHAAKFLDISRRILIYRMDKYGIATASTAD